MRTIQLEYKQLDLQIHGEYHPPEKEVGYTEDYEIYDIMHCGHSIVEIIGLDDFHNIVKLCIEYCNRTKDDIS